MRHVRAANRHCTAIFRVKPLRVAHRHVRTLHDGFLTDPETTAQKVVIGDAIHYLEADVRLAGGFSGTAAKRPPLPLRCGINTSKL